MGKAQLALDFTAPAKPVAAPAAPRVSPPRLRKTQRHAPFEVKSDTSRDAADSHTTPELARLEAVVLDAIRASGQTGMTDDEIEVATKLSHQTASARRRGLVLRGFVMDSDRRRDTRSGRAATVWIVKGETK